MRILSVRLDDQTDALLKTLCLRTGLSQTEVIKSGIAAVAREKPRPAELADALNLIGCFDSETTDLGRNHSVRLKQKLTASRRRA
jgi:antitoxin component of RelBE/YafQ-DinJ toxin-antitoxin module